MHLNQEFVGKVVQADCLSINLIERRTVKYLPINMDDEFVWYGRRRRWFGINERRQCVRDHKKVREEGRKLEQLVLNINRLKIYFVVCFTALSRTCTRWCVDDGVCAVFQRCYTCCGCCKCCGCAFRCLPLFPCLCSA